MDMEKSDALLSQLSTANESGVIDIVKSITEHPGLFVFGEFLDHPAIQKLKDSEFSKYFRLLDLFCFGSYEIYSLSPEEYPALSTAQIRKLKQLSIISEAHNRRNIPYDFLFQKLNISSSRELEDLIIDLFYLELLTGKLDQQKAILEVDSAIGRDIQDNQIPQLQASLETWLNRVDSVLVHIAKEIHMANERRYEVERHQKLQTETALSLKEAIKKQHANAEADALRMDIDDAFVHPDVLPDSRIATGRSVGELAGGGDKETTRTRMGMFKNLRHGKGNR